MQVTIPEQLKATAPQSTWGRILTATPVVMTVVATLLAGLASSEMTRAQYDRSLAAQQQSKAGDQWSYFQAKRQRGAIQRSTLDLLQAQSPVRPFRAADFRKTLAQLPAAGPDTATAHNALAALLDSEAGQQTLALLERGRLPDFPAASSSDPRIDAALHAIETMRPEPEILGLLAPIPVSALEKALRAAVARAQDFDRTLQPFTRTIDGAEDLLTAAMPADPAAVAPVGTASPERQFIVARLRYAEMRYEAEARLNQAIANIYEALVRKGNVSAERHHARSQRFFVGMLAAQAAVIIATFSIAAQRRSLLWSLAAVAGLAAIAFAIYVYFYV